MRSLELQADILKDRALLRDLSGQRKKQIAEKKRARARLRRHAAGVSKTTPLLASQGELTVLEQKCPGPPTRRDYENRLATFHDFCRKHKLDVEMPEDLDTAACDFCDFQFLQGEQADCGTKLLAALVHRTPELAKASGRALPRLARVLKSWRKFAPTPTRDPLPWLVTVGIAMQMAHNNFFEGALMVVLLFDTYMRFAIARVYFQFPFTLILMGLDIVVLYAYLKFSDGISKRTA